MLNEQVGLVIDADGHVLEPADTWQKYIEPQYRDRAARIDHDENGWEVLMFDNKPVELVRGTLGSIGGVGMDPEELSTPGRKTYADGCPRSSYDH